MIHNKIENTALREKIQSLTDGQFIDLLDTLLGFEHGLTATEWIEHQYNTGGTGARKTIDELEGEV